MFNNYAIVQGVDQIVPGRRVRARLPARARDADARHPHPARPDPHRRAAAPARGVAHRRRRHRGRAARRHPCRPLGRLSRRPRTRRRWPTTTLVKTITRTDAHERRRTPTARADDEVAAAVVERFPGTVFDRRTASRSCTSTARRSPTSRVPARRAAVHDVRRRDRRRPSCSTRRGSRSTALTPERFEVVANFLSHPRNRRVRVICEVPARRTVGAVAHRRVPGRELSRARDVRLVRHHVRRPSRSRRGS